MGTTGLHCHTMLSRSASSRVDATPPSTMSLLCKLFGMDANMLATYVPTNQLTSSPADVNPAVAASRLRRYPRRRASDLRLMRRFSSPNGTHHTAARSAAANRSASNNEGSDVVKSITSPQLHLVVQDPANAKALALTGQGPLLRMRSGVDYIH